MAAEDKEIAGIREDFIRRLFAVSVSVGFANQLIKNPLITGDPITATDGAALSLMFVALTAVATSWEGYLASVRQFPTVSVRRFYVDIFIVFAYLVLLLLSHRPLAWLIALCGIFGLYIIWDFFRILDYKAEYGIKAAESPACAALSLQFLFFMDNRFTKDRAGPAITVTWAVYFIALTGLAWTFDLARPYEQMAVAATAFLGILAYRSAKKNRRSWRFQLSWFSIPLIAMASIFSLNVFR